jgi:hypothetical protein
MMRTVFQLSSLHAFGAVSMGDDEPRMIMLGRKRSIVISSCPFPFNLLFSSRILPSFAICKGKRKCQRLMRTRRP